MYIYSSFSFGYLTVVFKQLQIHYQCICDDAVCNASVGYLELWNENHFYFNLWIQTYKGMKLVLYRRTGEELILKIL